LGKVITIKVKKKTIARYLDRFSWAVLGFIIGFSQGDWVAWLCYLPIFVIMQYASVRLEE